MTLLAEPDIRKKAQSEADQLKFYITRLRTDLRKTKDQWRVSSRAGAQIENAEMAFIVPDPGMKKRAKSKYSWYQLQLPRDRVMFVPAANPS
jgi:hypothetical protein